MSKNFTVTAFGPDDYATDEGPNYDFSDLGNSFGDGYRIYKERYLGARLVLHVITGAGDTLVIEGKFDDAHPWASLGSYPQNTNTIARLDPTLLWRVRRTAGTSTDTYVYWAI